MMVSGPLVGYFIGNWLDNKFDTAPYLMISWVILGLISSARESYKLLKQISDDSKDDDDDVRT
ncbi:MAG: AtpZ/AtpI family protein [FCB group bacterium]|nr:AtpZ/AtpI family protein [FCB group bacterium]